MPEPDEADIYESEAWCRAFFCRSEYEEAPWQDARAAHVESGGFSRRSALSAPRGVAQATPCP